MPPSRRDATHVEIIIEDRGINGVVRDSRGRETPFWGWLNLIAAVEACQQAGDDDSPAPPPPEPLPERTDHPSGGRGLPSDQQPLDPESG